MSVSADDIDLSQLAAGLADAAALLADAARQLSEAARSMGHGTKPETPAIAEPLCYGIPAPKDDSGEEGGSSDGQSVSEDENISSSDSDETDSRVGTSNNWGPNPFHHSESDQSTLQNENNPSLLQAPVLTNPNESHGSIIPPGRYYIVVEEAFDVLPLIAMYASVCRKMLCCMPFIEPSQSWRALLSSICTGHEVLEVTSSSTEWSQSAARYISSTEPSLLIQSFESWQTFQTVSSISDSLLVWGFLNIGDEQLRRIQDAVLSTPHTCAIVTPQEYERASFKGYLTSLGFIEHPKSIAFNKFFTTSLLARFRTIVQGVLHEPKFYRNVELLYKAFIEFYMHPPSDDINWSKTRVAQLANNFAAKILLHGREQDGSSRFKPDGRVLPVDQAFVDKLGPKRTFQLGAVQGVDLSNFVPSMPNVNGSWGPATSTTRQSNPAPIPTLSERWYINLQESFDAIPFISSQVGRNQKVVCFISYGTSAKQYRDIFVRMTSDTLISPSVGKKKMKAGIDTFNSLKSGLLLLPGSQGVSSRLGNFNTLIYWGAPAGFNPLNTTKASQTYVLLSSLDDSTVRTRTTQLNGIQEYPQSVQMNSTGPNSPLQPYRDKARVAMETIATTVINKIYASQITAGGKKKRKETIIRGNQFAVRVLLHGQPQDGSVLYPPIKPRPSLKAKQVSKAELQEFVSQGLIRIG